MKKSPLSLVGWGAVALVTIFLGKDFVFRVVEAIQVLTSLPAQ